MMDAREESRSHPGTINETAERPAQLLEDQVLHFALAAELEQLRGEPIWDHSDRDAITLVKEGDLRITLTVLKEGAQMASHSTDGYTSLQVLAGSLRVDAAGDSHEVGTGELLVLGRAVPHEVTALEDAAFLLTISLPEAT